MPPLDKTWHNIFFEDFDGLALDPTIWTTWDNAGGTALETFWASQVTLEDGKLKIVCDSIPRSGHIDTCDWFSFCYGWVEFRAKLPRGAGYWPAMWLLTKLYNRPVQSRTEIDIQEGNGGKPNLVQSSWHWGTLSEQDKNGLEFYANEDLSLDYHTYAVNWTAEKYEFYLDGKLIGVVTDHISHEAMYIAIQLALGGDWIGPPDANTIYPGVLLVDYVGVWQ